MDRQEIISKVRKILSAELAVDIERIVTESELVNDLGSDSLYLVEVAIALEEEFNIEIPDSDLERFTTVGAIVDYIEIALVPKED